MRPVVQSSTTTGVTPWVPLDYIKTPFSVSVAVTLTGAATYGLEHTYDNVFDPTLTPVAFVSTQIAAGSTTNKEAALSAPVRAVRLNITANAGVVKMTVLQGL